MKENGQRAPFFNGFGSVRRAGAFFPDPGLSEGAVLTLAYPSGFVFDTGLQAFFSGSHPTKENAQTGNRARCAQAGIGETGHAGTLLSLHVTER